MSYFYFRFRDNHTGWIAMQATQVPMTIIHYQGPNNDQLPIKLETIYGPITKQNRDFLLYKYTISFLDVADSAPYSYMKYLKSCEFSMVQVLKSLK